MQELEGCPSSPSSPSSTALMSPLARILARFGVQETKLQAPPLVSAESVGTIKIERVEVSSRQTETTAVVALLRTPAPPWDAAGAERLLSELRAEVARVEWENFRGKLPVALNILLTDALIISARYIRDYEREMARGWDSIELLRDMVPHVRNCVGNWRLMQEEKPFAR